VDGIFSVAPLEQIEGGTPPHSNDPEKKE
jgi:hypothetical protein